MPLIRYMLSEIFGNNKILIAGRCLQPQFGTLFRNCHSLQPGKQSPIDAKDSNLQSTPVKTANKQSAVTATDTTQHFAPKENELDTLYSRVILETRAHDPAVLKSYEWFALEAAKLLQIPVHQTITPKYHFLRRNLLKSIFVHKKHQVHYEFRTYFKIIELKHLTGSTADTYLEYIQRNLPEGVAMRVTKTAIEVLPSHFKPPAKNLP